MPRTTKSEIQVDRLEELMTKLVNQNLALGHQNLLLGQRMDATNQRIDNTLHEIHAQGMEMIRMRQEWLDFKNEVFPILEKLPEAVKNQIGFRHKKE